MVQVVVKSVVALSATQLEKIKKSFMKKYGKEVMVVATLDPSLIGGVTITVESRQLDGSVRSKFEQIKSALQKKLLS